MTKRFCEPTIGSAYDHSSEQDSERDLADEKVGEQGEEALTLERVEMTGNHRYLHRWNLYPV